MLLKRIASDKILELAANFPAVSVSGPRQSGKTTLIRKLFDHLPYVNFEDPETRLRAESDFKGFLSRYRNGAVFDEAQKVPNLFSYLQIIIDENRQQKGRFIISGSENFLLSAKISQSFAGRIGVFNLLPLSLFEAKQAVNFDNIWEHILYGFYPEVVTEKKDQLWHASYIETYVERDIRNIVNVQDLGMFRRFLKLLAGRNAHVLNSSNLSDDLG